MRSSSDLTAQGLANLAHSFATANCGSARLFDALGSTIAGEVDNFNAQELSNAAWSFAVADAAHDGLWGGDAFLRACDVHAWSKRQLCQLHQWNLWRKEHVEKRGWEPLPEELSRRCYEAFVDAGVSPSRLQRQVRAPQTAARTTATATTT